MDNAPHDEDNHQLIVKLCSEAGSIMEFASADAITIRSVNKDQLPAKLDELIEQTETVNLLLKSARALRTNQAG